VASKKKTTGFEVIRWIEAHCVFTQGEWIGKPFRLLPWQKRILLELFEQTDAGVRRYRWALVGVPKKQGKTELAAALALYLLIGDGEPSPLVCCAAASEEQADLVFGAAKTMCEFSPTLSLITERWEREITVPSIPGARLRRVAAAAGTNDGQNIHAVICDELHEWLGDKGENVWNVLTNGTGARKQPLVLQITTAGYDRDSVCFRQYEYGRKVLAGEIDDPRYFFHWTEPSDPKCDHTDPAVWAEVNPSYGVTVSEDFYSDQVNKKPENVFRRYFLNQWTESIEAWLPPGAWARCEDPLAVIPEGSRVTLAVDIGYVFDSSAVVTLWERDDGTTVVKANVWTPRGDGTQLDINLIEAFIREQARIYRVQAVVYDPALFISNAQRLSDDGFVMVKYPQSPKRMIEATGKLYEAIKDQKVIHDGDPILASHVAAAAVKAESGAFRLVKGKAKRPIDAVIAMALGYSQCGLKQKSFFEMYGIPVI
jgi:phage terminase large subunit-like protein